MSRLARWSPVVLAVVCAGLYLLDPPHTSDLAAQTARAELFSRSGFVAYWAGWYAGIPTASYSLVTPPLLSLVGAPWLGALSIIATAGIVVPLLRDAVRPRAGAVCFVLAATLDVVAGRTTFAVGAAIAFAAVLAAERSRTTTTGFLALAATAASPVAGVLLLAPAAGFVVADRGRRRQGVAIGVGVLVLLGILEVLARGGSGGYEPLSRTSLLMSCGTALVVVVAPVGARVRAGAAAAVVLLVVVFAVHSPIGANATRIAVLGSTPVIVAAARWDRRWLAAGVVVASLLPFAQLRADLSVTKHVDTTRAFVGQLLTRLNTDPAVRGHRVEVVDTATHWPSTYLLPQEMLARGWERQTDELRNPQFYGRAPLTATTYRQFLDRSAVSVVAVPVGVGLDYGSVAEARLIRSGLPYLQLAWTSPHWDLYDVARPSPMVSGRATVTAHSDSGVTIDAPAAGSYAVKLRWSPYLVVDGGSVHRASDGDVTVVLRAAGTYRLHAKWRL
jgi:hypothetical protein